MIDAVGCFGAEESKELIRVFLKGCRAHTMSVMVSPVFVLLISRLSFPVQFLNRSNGAFRMLYGWSNSPGQRYMIESSAEKYEHY